MTLKDSYAFSLHTIKENKSRSILTVIISTFLSLLIMGLMCIVISFVNNGNKILNKVYFEDSIVSVEYSNQWVGGDQKLFDKSYYPAFKELLKNNEDIVSYVAYSLPESHSRYNTVLVDPDYPVSTGIEIIEGRNIVPGSDIPEVIVSQNAYASSYSYGGNPLSVGSIHEETIGYETGTRRRRQYIEYKLKYKVVGVYNITGEKYLIDGQKSSAFESYQMVADINLWLDKMTADNKNVYISNMKIYYKNSVEGLSVEGTINRLKKFSDDIENTIPKTMLEFREEATGAIEYIEKSPMRVKVAEDYKSLDTNRMIFLGGGGVLSLVLLLMSVGSLANSVMISIDRSKKFIGLLKALGVKGSELKRVIIMESVTLIALGVAIAYGLLWALSSPLNMITSALVNSIYGNYVILIGYVPFLELPIYVFLGAIVLFVLLTLVFARGSLRRISKMDPMAVISEVS